MQKVQLFRGRDLLHVAMACMILFGAVVAVVYYYDPYGRAGIRSSSQVPNVGERELKVSVARNPLFDSAVVGNSTSIPMQPEILDGLTGRKFVSLSVSGSGAPVALTVARFFLRHHPAANTIIVAMDDTWCRNERTMAEGRPFPFWLYSGNLEYIGWLYANMSFELLNHTFFAQGNGFRVDGYRPYDVAFVAHGYDDIAFVKAVMDKVIRPTGTDYVRPFRFEPLIQLEELVSSNPRVTFILFWTPRYLTLIPVQDSPAADYDNACKQRSIEIVNRNSNARIVNWAGDSSENRNPANFYETNHYRDTLAIKIEHDIAKSISAAESP